MEGAWQTGGVASLFETGRIGAWPEGAESSQVQPVRGVTEAGAELVRGRGHRGAWPGRSQARGGAAREPEASKCRRLCLGSASSRRSPRLPEAPGSDRLARAPAGEVARDADAGAGPAWSCSKPRTTTSCSRASARCGAAAATAPCSCDPVRGWRAGGAEAGGGWGAAGAPGSRSRGRARSPALSGSAAGGARAGGRASRSPPAAGRGQRGRPRPCAGGLPAGSWGAQASSGPARLAPA